MDLRSGRDLYIVLTAPVLGLLVARFIHNVYHTAFHNGVSVPPRIYKAPSTCTLTPAEEESIPYPPDALAGGRNITTPYGNIRAYEWGPEAGRRVLFVHGISTPCISLAPMARRGYSDCPDTDIFRQDIGLFSSLILSVISTSPLSWTCAKTSTGFTLVGYSLGGGIAAAFTSHYPELVSSLVLIAPGGLLRPTRLSLSSRVLYSGLLPDVLSHYFVSRRLRVTAPTSKATQGHIAEPAGNRRSSLSSAIQEELPDDFDAHAPGQDSLSPVFDDRPSVSPATAVAWQVDGNPGFVPAFISCIRYAPIHDGFELWRRIGQRCVAARVRQEEYAKSSSATLSSTSSSASIVERARYGSDSGQESPHSSASSFGLNVPIRSLDEGKVLVVLGTRDVIIMPEETAHDVTAALGKPNVQLEFVQGGHDLVLSNTKQCADAITRFWDNA